jgi:hypothetical protein
LRTKLWLAAGLAAALALPAPARAQEGDGGDAKKGAAGGEKKKEADAGKTLGFGERPGGWKDGSRPARGAVKALWKTDAAEGDADGATVQVRALGTKATWDRQLDFWCSHYEDKDGKKLEKSAVKTESFEAGGIPVKMADVAGTFVSTPQKRDGEDAPKPVKKAGERTIGCFLEGPDGGFAVSIYGPEKSVEKAREAFLGFVKTVKIVEKPAGSGGDERPGKREKKPGDDE